MKVIYFGFNSLSSCLDALLHTSDIDVVCVYTGEEEIHTHQIVNLCQQHAIPVESKQPSMKDLTRWVDSGVSCFVSAEYAFKIPLPTSLKYSINIHPTLLPEGRGQTPLPHIILNYPEIAGITLHKLSDQLDTGDILKQIKLTIDDNETFDSLLTKVFLEAPTLLMEVISQIETYDKQATKQVEGSYWKTIGEDEQFIDWLMPTKKIDTICRAFGSLGVKFTLNEIDYYTTTSERVKYPHAYQAGDVIVFDEMKLIVATLEGFMIIPRDSLFQL